MPEKSKPAQIEAATRELLDALDRMHGNQSLSYNVDLWRRELRGLLSKELDPADKATRAA